MIGDEENIGLGQALYIYFVIIKKINEIFGILRTHGIIATA
jgi:hypothetical protein